MAPLLSKFIGHESVGQFLLGKNKKGRRSLSPQEIVDFMCASVEEVLKTEFNLTLGSKGVNILDPCTGTGNFIVNLINRIPKKDLPRVYKEQLFANEVVLLPGFAASRSRSRQGSDCFSSGSEL